MLLTQLTNRLVLIMGIRMFYTEHVTLHLCTGFSAAFIKFLQCLGPTCWLLELVLE